MKRQLLNSLSIALVILSFLVMAVPWSGGQQTPSSRQASPEASANLDQRIAKETRHELVMLPFYSVFDNLAFKAEGESVTLLGQVRNATLKSDAERAVKRIEGVDKVSNQIEVLPPSPGDDRLRMAVFRAIYGNTALQRYAIQSVPPIHIIVNRGHVTLEGVVANEEDKNIANIQANSVPGVFSVTNNLRVEKGS